MITNCEICNRPYEKNNQSAVCSKSCRLLRQKNLRERKKGSRIRRCGACGNDFIQRKKATVCSGECRQEMKKRYDSKYHSEQYKKVQANRLEEKKCAQCGVRFSTFYAREVCCSTKCKQVRMRHQQLDHAKHQSNDLTDHYVSTCIRLPVNAIPKDILEIAKIRILVKRELQNYDKYPHLKPRPRRNEPRKVKCECCGSEFHSGILKQKFCSKRCRVVVEYQRRKA
jgi:hypothetical protein